MSIDDKVYDSWNNTPIDDSEFYFIDKGVLIPYSNITTQEQYIKVVNKAYDIALYDLNNEV